MKIFKKKEEKNKVGRPKLADEETKKKAIISVCIALAMVAALLLTGAFKLNIIKLNKLKGQVNTSLCSQIPARFQPKSESNPEGLHEYGFTDPKFYSAVLSGGSITDEYPYNYQYNKSYYCSTITEDELKSITNLDANYEFIDNADGVQYLTGLTNLYLGSNNISSIDVSKNTALTNLYLGSNNISSIDVSKNTALTNLYLSYNNISSIDVSKNTALTSLSLSNNNISSIDVSKNTALTSLNLPNNNISSIDVSKNTALTDLSLYNNNISSIDVSKNTALESLNLGNYYSGGNNISSIDVSQNTGLRGLRLANNNISSIDVSQNTALTYLDLTDNNLKNIDISKNTALEEIYLNNNDLESIDVSNGSGFIHDLELNGNNNLKSINLSNVEIFYGTFSFNEGSLETFIAKNSSFYNLDLSNNNLSNIDLGGNEVLSDINLTNNNLNSIDLSTNPNVKKLNLSNNKFSTLDLSKNGNLQFVSLHGNNLNEIMLPDSNSLQSLILSNNNLSGKLDLSKYQTLNSLILYDNKLEEVILGNNSELHEVMLHNNNLSNIDLGNTSVSELTLQNNPLLRNIYIAKGQKLSYKENVTLPENFIVNYNIDDISIASLKDGVITAEKEGNTSIKVSSENIKSWKTDHIDKCLDYENNQDYCDSVVLPYFLSQEIKVYDITSDVYKVDKDKKTINVSGIDLDVNKIKLTLEGLSGAVDKDNFIIKDGETIVDTYKILNKGIVTNNSNGSDNSSNNKNNKTTKKSNSRVTTKEDLSDIKIEGNFLSMLTLQTVKGKDRNIILENDGITLTINGKDIEDVKNNINLNVTIETIKDSKIGNEVKEDVEKGVILNISSDYNLPKKVLVEVKVEDKNIKPKEVQVYNYNERNYNLIAQDLSMDSNRKIKFYVNKTGYYVITNNKIEDKKVEVDSSMLGKNTKLNEKNNTGIIIGIGILLLVIITIGYITYKKKKKK